MPGAGGTRANGGSSGSQGGTGGKGGSANGGSGNTAGGGTTGGSGAVSSGGSGGSVSPGATPVERHGQLSVNGTSLVDAQGQPVKLEGMSSMWLNWEPTGYALDKQGLIWMRDNWNLRVFRIAMGVSVEGDENTYLADPTKNKGWVNTIVQNAIDAGVYVIIDWHDHEALDHQADAIAFFGEMSARWGDSPNVIYEVFNEPLDLDWSTELKPYHEAVVQAIRANDPDNVIVLGTPNWDQDVDVAAGNPLAGSNLMYTLHFYACTHQAANRQRAQQAFNAGLPLFVTEWGATNADGGLDGIVCTDEASAWHDWLDAANISWAAWKLDGCTDATCMFKDRTASPSGGWTTSVLNGHAPFVIQEMTNDPPDTAGTGGTGGGTGGSSGTGGMAGGSGGTGGSTTDPLNTEACALVSTCPSCCSSTGAFALDADSNDATARVLTAFSAAATSAEASFAFDGADQVGAIFFRFAEPEAITGLAVDAYYLGGSLEVALVEGSGASGCTYVQATDLWVEDSCWGTPSGSFDQLEVRVRSFGAAGATLEVYDVAFE
jgi:endoglucanase